MNYGNPKATTGGVLVLTGLTLGEQIAVVLAAIILVVAVAVTLRGRWRKGQNLGE